MKRLGLRAKGWVGSKNVLDGLFIGLGLSFYWVNFFYVSTHLYTLVSSVCHLLTQSSPHTSTWSAAKRTGAI